MFHEFTHAVAPFMWAGMGILWVIMHHRQKMARIAAERGYDPRLRGHHIAEMEAMAASHAREQGCDHAREVAELKERIRVLERIATDEARQTPARQLAAQIDALKD
ncbi:hypothetical protein [Novosphingobium sp.]|uniref:hypothetical protein n=1 Tax=Novosphingobium sp. TaxID=1874826 RepID=UPI0031D5787F